MAKKAKVSSLGCDAMCAGDYPRTVYFDLEDDETALLKDMKVGDTVVMVVKGTISSISVSDRKTEDGTTKTGTLRLDNPDFEVTTKGIWAQLADDSED